MGIPGLSDEIVKNRQDKAPYLKAIGDKLSDHRVKLETVSKTLRELIGLDAPEIKKSQQEIVNILDEINPLKERVDIRHQRFANGLITISIAGLEKAGKTTFLKSLTGIDSLPAFDERCTAVCCEIHYADDRSDFDIEFYTEAEFLDRILRPVIETITAALPETVKSVLIPPTTASDFLNTALPSPEVLTGGTTAYKLLKDLYTIQANFHECRQNLGRPPLYKQPLTELKDWVSHKPADLNAEQDSDQRGRHLARVTAVKVCRIYTRFEGGSPHLRWIDTPGVDDPNRRARDMTLSTIASQTDLLVVASRPGSNPSPGESFHHFWDSVSRQPDEIDLLSRLLFVLNCDRRVDSEGENIRIHQKYLVDAGVPQQLFAGPYEATNTADAAALMERVNEHLVHHLADQDNRVIKQFESRLKNVQARIRLLHDALVKCHPSDSDQYDLETNEFHKWFHWYTSGKDAGFWVDLVEELDRSARSISDDPRINESETDLNTIFAQEVKEIQQCIPTSKDLEEYVIKHRGENPIPNGMRIISMHFSKLVNRLSNAIQEFGPIMQDELVDVFNKAGLGPLLAGKTSAEKIKSLLDHSEVIDPASPILEVLKETLDLPRNLKYVLRYELRGAVDFCDPTLWNEKEEAWKRLTEMLNANGGDIARLATFATNRHPPVSDSRTQDTDILKKIAANSMLAIQSVLNNERYLPRRIADDFMRDCRVRLCFSPEAEQEWRTLLFSNRGVLLAQTIGQIRAKSERIRNFNTALNNLEINLP